MDSKVDARTTRKRNPEKKGGESSLDNRRSSEDTANKHLAFSGAEADLIQVSNSRNTQNPVLVAKGKGDYQSFGNKNRGDRYNKLGSAFPLYTQSMDLASFDTGAVRSNLIKKSAFLPSISVETNADDRKKQADDPNAKELIVQGGLISADSESRVDQNITNQLKPQKATQASKLPVINRTRAAASENTRKQKEKENDDKGGLIITNSKLIDVEVVPHNKSTSNVTSPLALKGNTAFNHPKPVPKGPRNSTKINEFKLVASGKKNEEIQSETLALHNENQDINSAEASPMKKDISDFSKTQNAENMPAVDGQNNDTGVEGYATNLLTSSVLIVHDVSNKTAQEDSSQNEDSTKDPSIKESHSEASSHHTHSNKENPPEIQKITSPKLTRKTLNPKNKLLEEGKSANNTFEEKKVAKSRLNKTSIENQDELIKTEHADHERRNIGRNGPRQRISTMNINNQPTSHPQPSNNNHNVSVKESTDKDQEKEKKATTQKTTASVTKNAYKTISNIAKTSEKQANRGNFHSEKPAGENQRYYAYLDYLYKVSFTFAVVNRPPSTQLTYKFYIGKGNNGLMVRTLLKTRWWWMPTDSAETAEVNLIWTQLRNNNVIESLKTKKKQLETNSTLSANTSVLDNSMITTTTDTHSHDSVTDVTDSDSEVSSMRSSIDKGKPKKTRSKKAPADSKTSSSGDPLNKLYTATEYGVLQNFMSNYKKKLLFAEDTEELVKSSKKASNMTVLDPTKVKICNRMECNYHLSNKKALFYNMRAYYEALKENPFDYLPLTFHIKSGTEDKDYQKFLEYYHTREKEVQEIEKQYNEADANEKKALQSKRIKNIWIIKPGEHTNRGQGIRVASELPEIEQIVNSGEKHINGMHKTYIVQQYLDHPLLYNKRKFDIRCYMMITSINGYMKGYWYQDGYIRTCSKEYTTKNLSNIMVHLTNDAVQKKGEEYGKFENGNKVSFAEFQKYLDLTMPDAKVNFQTDIYPKMKNMARDSIRAVYGKIDPNRREQTFEVFGLDFMIDQNFKPWIIEVNTNPCLELSSPLLARIIPTMVENALRIAVDPLFPPPMPPSSKKHLIPDNMFENNKFELIFDEVEDEPWIRSLSASNNDAAMGQISEEEEEEDSENEHANENNDP